MHFIKDYLMVLYGYIVFSGCTYTYGFSCYRSPLTIIKEGEFLYNDNLSKHLNIILCIGMNYKVVKRVCRFAKVSCVTSMIMKLCLQSHAHCYYTLQHICTIKIRVINLYQGVIVQRDLDKTCSIKTIVSIRTAYILKFNKHAHSIISFCACVYYIQQGSQWYSHLVLAQAYQFLWDYHHCLSPVEQDRVNCKAENCTCTYVYTCICTCVQVDIENLANNKQTCKYIGKFLRKKIFEATLTSKYFVN